MKQIICSLFIACIFIPATSKSQIKMANLSYQDALKKIQSTEKLLFVAIYNPDCVVCKDMILEDFGDTALANIVNKNFLAISLSDKDENYLKLADKFPVYKSSGILFIDNKGNVLHRTGFGNKSSKAYITACKKAISNKVYTDTLELFKKEYLAKRTDPTFIKDYINYKKKTAEPTDSLLDEYVSLLPQDSFINSIPNLQFLMQNAPVIDSKAHIAMYSNKNSFNEAWYRLDRKDRPGINYNTREKTFKKAIKEKNDNYAIKVIKGYTEWNKVNRSKLAQRRYHLYLSNYYWYVKDTLLYIAEATSYIENYIINTDVDSIKRLDAKYVEKVDSLNAESEDSIEINTNKLSKFYATTLNHHAWNFYKVSTNLRQLRKASYWSLRSLEFDENNAASLDTYARLLYKLGEKQQAIETEKKAVEIVKSKKYINSTREFEKVLANMIAGKKDID